MIPVEEVYRTAQWLHKINRKTIRYYVSKSLLPSTTKVGRCAFYNNKEKIVFIIGLIRDMQKAGISLDNIRHVMRDVTDN